MPLPKFLLQRIRERARYRCEYCHYPEILSTTPLSVDYIQPYSNPQTGVEAPIFNPRTQNWSDHFIWSADSLPIIGITTVG